MNNKIHAYLIVDFIRVRKGKFMDAGNSDDQDNDRVDRLMNGNSI